MHDEEACRPEVSTTKASSAVKWFDRSLPRNFAHARRRRRRRHENALNACFLVAMQACGKEMGQIVQR